MRPLIPCQSSAFGSFRYNPRTRRLTLVFKNGRTIYRDGVTWEGYIRFAGAPSKGRHYHLNLKKKNETRPANCSPVATERKRAGSVKVNQSQNTTKGRA